MALGLVINWAGGHVASWKHPAVPPGAAMSFDYYRDLAALAERARFDLLFLADHLSVGEAGATPERLQKSGEVVFFEPMILLAGLAAITRHIGLTATVSTTYNEPYNVARVIASLDHLSGGRAGWNVVTTGREAAAPNYGQEKHMQHADRYHRAHEFLDVVRALWDSWDDDAFLHDKARGIFFDKDRIHFQNHVGEHFSVKGPLNVARPPQGHPLIIQAGSSDAGQDLAAATADVVFTGQLTLEGGQRFYRGLKARMAALGRSPDSLKVMPGLVPIVGRTSAEAQEKFNAIQGLIDGDEALLFLSQMLGGADLSGVPHDTPGPDLPMMENRGTSGPKLLQEKAKRENLTLRQLAYEVAGARRHRLVIGSATEVADQLELWFKNEAADGFNIFPAWMPGGVEDFAELVIPELQRRGLYRTDYEGKTLRENLGLKRPPNRYTERRTNL
ncbi:MAG: LLM class flavin-dependent oxidoreductase [Betaproteobacteria bacterium]|nr:LLM class flavin-dependent oxidoreductase [Betaproteobacteria bacterium]